MPLKFALELIRSELYTVPNFYLVFSGQIHLFRHEWAMQDSNTFQRPRDLLMVDSDIRIYHHPNPQIKSFLTNTEISVPRVEAFQQPLDRTNKGVLKQIGSIPGQIVRDVMSIRVYWKSESSRKRYE